MYWMLMLRRARRTYRLWCESKQVCGVCGCSVDRYEYVCSEEACQLSALCGQALLAHSVAEPPAALHRVKYASARGTKSDSMAGLAAVA